MWKEQKYPVKEKARKIKGTLENIYSTPMKFYKFAKVIDEQKDVKYTKIAN
jgi:hypothetical protein